MPPVARNLDAVKPNRDMRIIRLPEVKRKLGLGKSTIYEMMKRADCDFPKPVRLGPNSIGFVEHEVDQWILDRVNARGVK